MKAQTSLMARGDKVRFLPVGIEVDRRPRKEEPYSIASSNYIVLPVKHIVVSDNRGVVLPRCDVFFLPRFGATKKLDPDEVVPDALDEAKAFYGNTPLGTAGVRMPSGSWKKVADIDWIEYYRWSEKVESGDYHHPFKEPLTLWKSTSAQMWKLPLPDGCRLTWRGFVYP